MSVGASFRVGRGFVHIGGGGAVAMLVRFAFLSGFVRVMLLVVCALVIIIIFFGVMYMHQARTKELLGKAIEQSAVKPDGPYTGPKTWGVYEVERLREGKRGKGFHFGNHPVRHTELVRQFGEAQLVALFEARIDAEELAYLLNGKRRGSQ